MDFALSDSEDAPRAKRFALHNAAEEGDVEALTSLLARASDAAAADDDFDPVRPRCGLRNPGGRVA